MADFSRTGIYITCSLILKFQIFSMQIMGMNKATLEPRGALHIKLVNGLGSILIRGLRLHKAGYVGVGEGSPGARR
jgi:hypothetical protein